MAVNTKRSGERASLVRAAAADSAKCQVPKKRKSKGSRSPPHALSHSLCCCVCVHLILIGIYGSLSTSKTRRLRIVIGLRRT